MLDGSTGQNAYEQAKRFTEATDVNELAITKLDGTAKGGVVIGISDQFKIPVKYIGIGEGMEDLQLFNAFEFVRSLFGSTANETAHRHNNHGLLKESFDSERLMKRLEARGYAPVHNSSDVTGPVVVVNTCGFIADAKQESIDMILELAQAKEEGRIEKLIVMGCLSQRHGAELKPEIPEVDAWYGKFDWDNMVEALPVIAQQPTPRIWERKLTTPPYSTFMKISEGCDRMCAYCAIPLITGRHRSRSMEEILEETRSLAAKGVKEFNVIAQDLSDYGKDRYGELKLPELIERMSDIKGVDWIRLHYAYPTDFPWGITKVMREREMFATILIWLCSIFPLTF